MTNNYYKNKLKVVKKYCDLNGHTEIGVAINVLMNGLPFLIHKV